MKTVVNKVIEIYTLQNQKVYQDAMVYIKDYQFSLGNLSSGTYLLKITNGTGTIVKRIIKN